MAYYHFKGVKYGVCPRRSIWKSLLVNIPIINLLYSKKIKVSLTSRTKEGLPMIGTNGQFRIFRWQKTVHYRFMPPDTFTNVYIRVTDPSENVKYVTYDCGTSKLFNIGHEYRASMSLTGGDNFVL